MRQILFVQGAGKDVHDQWDDKLVESLRRELGPSYEVRYPLMPHEDDPKVATWGAAIESEMAALQSGAIVVGHSVGGTILINVLAERAPAVALGAIVLIAAPFVGPGGWKSDDLELRPDLAARLPHGVPVYLYHGSRDATAPVAHVNLYAAAIPRAHVRQLANRDHQLDNNLSEIASDIRALEEVPVNGRPLLSITQLRESSLFRWLWSMAVGTVVLDLLSRPTGPEEPNSLVVLGFAAFGAGGTSMSAGIGARTLVGSAAAISYLAFVLVWHALREHWGGPPMLPTRGWHIPFLVFMAIVTALASANDAVRRSKRIRDQAAANE